jgi:hypothetical protein
VSTAEQREGSEQDDKRSQHELACRGIDQESTASLAIWFWRRTLVYNSINPTFSGFPRHRAGWISRGHFALDQGPVVLMIENYRSGLLWRLAPLSLRRGWAPASRLQPWLADWPSRMKAHVPRRAFADR